MTNVRVHSIAFTGVEAVHVEVEVQKTRGLYGKIAIVGLPGGAVRESRERVRAAIQSSDFVFTRSALIVNLAPADLRKEGPSFDLPLALGILAASEVINPKAMEGFTIVGELALDGRVKPIPGILAATLLARDLGHEGIILAAENQREAQLVDGIRVIPTHHLRHAVTLLGGPENPEDSNHLVKIQAEIERQELNQGTRIKAGPDFKEVTGQEIVKTAMIVAAAGGHNLLMIGPPGSGKTMLARRLPTILPPLRKEESLAVSRIYSFVSKGIRELIRDPPFRAPHHTISYAGLLGGGSIPSPGEISLAHNGILYLDELPEFERRNLEALRQPLEEGLITLVRARGAITLPAEIILVAAMNPCPCGFRGDKRRPCVCTPRQATLYQNRISGPLLDRFDLQVEVPAISPELLYHAKPGLDSKTMAKAVAEARDRQLWRTRNEAIHWNAFLNPNQMKMYCKISPKGADYLNRCMRRYPFSARGYTRILKVARTLADLDSKDTLDHAHIEKAVMFRVLDRSQ